MALPGAIHTVADDRDEAMIAEAELRLKDGSTVGNRSSDLYLAVSTGEIDQRALGARWLHGVLNKPARSVVLVWGVRAHQHLNLSVARRQGPERLVENVLVEALGSNQVGNMNFKPPNWIVQSFQSRPPVLGMLPANKNPILRGVAPRVFAFSRFGGLPASTSAFYSQYSPPWKRVPFVSNGSVIDVEPNRQFKLFVGQAFPEGFGNQVNLSESPEHPRD